jgi:hypothetical protein
MDQYRKMKLNILEKFISKETSNENILNNSNTVYEYNLMIL